MLVAVVKLGLKPDGWVEIHCSLLAVFSGFHSAPPTKIEGFYIPSEGCGEHLLKFLAGLQWCKQRLDILVV